MQQHSLLEEEKIITTRLQKKTEKSPERYRTDFDGRGNAIDFPIIYLGLKRLIPLASEKKITLKKIKYLQNIPIHFRTYQKKYSF